MKLQQTTCFGYVCHASRIVYKETETKGMLHDPLQN